MRRRLGRPRGRFRRSQFREPCADAVGHDDVLLPLVARKRLLERLGRVLIGGAGECQHLGEVGERLSLSVELCRSSSGDRERLAREPLPLGMVAAACEQLRLHLPPGSICESS